jgi:hypothetical protein
MKKTLVVVIGLGCFKAFRLENHHPNQAPHLELVEEFNNADAHGKLGDKVTDLSGRFPRNSGTANATGAMADGERHNIELESRKRLVRQLAQRFNALARGPDVERCLLAASREINHQFLEELEPQVRAKIEKSIPDPGADRLQGRRLQPGKRGRHCRERAQAVEGCAGQRRRARHPNGAAGVAVRLQALCALRERA